MNKREYIVNEILLLPSKLYGIINAMISVGLILGSVLGVSVVITIITLTLNFGIKKKKSR